MCDRAAGGAGHHDHLSRGAQHTHSRGGCVGDMPCARCDSLISARLLAGTWHGRIRSSSCLALWLNDGYPRCVPGRAPTMGRLSSASTGTSRRPAHVLQCVVHMRPHSPSPPSDATLTLRTDAAAHRHGLRHDGFVIVTLMIATFTLLLQQIQHGFSDSSRGRARECVTAAAL